MGQAQTYYITTSKTIPEGGLSEPRCAVSIFNYTGQVIQIVIDGNYAQSLKIIPYMERVISQRIRRNIKIQIPHHLHPDEYVEVIFYSCEGEEKKKTSGEVYENQNMLEVFKQALREIIREEAMQRGNY